MRQEINLLGTGPRRERRSLNSAVVLGPVLLVALAAGVAGGFFAKYEARTLRGLHAANVQHLQREQDEQRKLAQELAAVKKDPALVAEAAELERRLAAVRLDVEALRDGVIGDTKGFSDFMKALALRGVDGIWLTGFSVGAAGEEIAISGRALRADLVPAYLKRLGQDPYFSGRSFAGLDLAQARGDGPAASALAFSLTSKRERAPAGAEAAVPGSTGR